MSTIINQLNRRLESDLHEINHESLNSTFVGYSNLYRQSNASDGPRRTGRRFPSLHIRYS